MKVRVIRHGGIIVYYQYHNGLSYVGYRVQI